MTDSVYFRLLRRSDGSITVVEMQYFDEQDYDQSKFVTPDHFATHVDAVAWLQNMENQELRAMLKNLLLELEVVSEYSVHVSCENMMKKIEAILATTKIS